MLIDDVMMGITHPSSSLLLLLLHQHQLLRNKLLLQQTQLAHARPQCKQQQRRQTRYEARLTRVVAEEPHSTC
jgi:hypothetical protein